MRNCIGVVMNRNTTNCFIFTCDKLSIKPPNWGGWVYEEDKKEFIKDYKYFLKQRLHIEYFESFCDKVEVAKKGDVILNNLTIGIAINNRTFQTIREKNGKITIEPIGKNLIFRLRNG